MELQFFLDRWPASAAAERSNKDTFIVELCDLIGVERPHPARKDPQLDTYVFEREVHLAQGGRAHSIGRIDLYKSGHFILEAKQATSAEHGRRARLRRESPAWNVAMREAYGQALKYARVLPDPPPFLLVCDIGYCLDIYACFDRSGLYSAFPTPQKSRLYLKELEDEGRLRTLRSIFIDPYSLDPSRESVRVTRDVAKHLAELAVELRGIHRDSELVAKFLMRCIFTMFAEGVGLLPERLFARALESRWIANPGMFPSEVEDLWQKMNTGGSIFNVGRIPHVNGGLFAQPNALPLTRSQLERLLEAARRSWAEVDPAIFGTLLEEALDPVERRRLGAHYTPRSYVQRLVRYTIEEPLRNEWEVVQAQAHALARQENLRDARRTANAFLRRLAGTRVLDPACGTGNFLYVTLEVLKQLESEVVDLLQTLGQTQEEFESEATRVTPKRLTGIEIKPWAREIAELVLWIGYIQWHVRSYGTRKMHFPIPEPVLPKDTIVQEQDALLSGNRRTTWPETDFVVGNPPFLGKSRLRECLTEEYVDRLRAAYDDVPDSVDLVMYWWHRAAELLRDGKIRRFGLVTTNSITQIYNRRVVGAFLRGARPIHLTHAIPSHPWVDTENGAAVRIAMTVAARGTGPGRRFQVVAESRPSEYDGAAQVEFTEEAGVIHEDLHVDVRVSMARPLAANCGLAGAGVMLGGRGFIVPPGDPLYDGTPQVRPILHGRDLLQNSRQARVIDFAGMTETEAKRASPAAFRRIVAEVKPERETNNRATRRERYWLFSEVMPATRKAIAGLRRYIITPETSKHRLFFFVDGDVLPEHPLLAIGVDDAFILAVLSSRTHELWALRTGGTLEDRPRYNKTVCFETFPFPKCGPRARAKLETLGERLDRCRKALARQSGATITALYNILYKLRAGAEVSAKERPLAEAIRSAGLVAIHEQIDAEVLAAYDLSPEVSDSDIMRELLALNARRAMEERQGTLQWLRPEYQVGQVPTPTDEPGSEDLADRSTSTDRLAWPDELGAKIAAVRNLLYRTGVGMSTAELAGRFCDRSGRKIAGPVLLPIVRALSALGLAAEFSEGEQQIWQALPQARGLTRPSADDGAVDAPERAGARRPGRGSRR